MTRLLDMPGRSALLAAVDERAIWTQSDYLAAALIDEVAMLNYYFVLANTEKKDQNTVQRPQPVPRPGEKTQTEEKPQASSKPVEQKEKKFASPQEVANVFARLNGL